MSGRSGYRKTNRKQTRRASPTERADYVLKFPLPPMLALAVSVGTTIAGITIGYNNIVFAHGESPRKCAEIAAAFLFKLDACKYGVDRINATIIKLQPCAGYWRSGGCRFHKLTVDLEALHDNAQRCAHRARPCQLHVGVEDILVLNLLTRQLVIESNGKSHAS